MNELMVHDGNCVEQVLSHLKMTRDRFLVRTLRAQIVIQQRAIIQAGF